MQRRPSFVTVMDNNVMQIRPSFVTVKNDVETSIWVINQTPYRQNTDTNNYCTCMIRLHNINVIIS